MAEIRSLRVTLDGEHFAASIEALCSALEGAPDGVASSVCESLVALLENGDVFFVESPDLSASWATVLHAFELKPTDRYRELIAAAADNLGCDIAWPGHGWPILSVVGRTPTVAEAGGEAIAPGGGLIA